MTFVDWLKSLLRWVFRPPDAPDHQVQLGEILDRLHGELRDVKICAADRIRDEKRIIAERDRYLSEAAAAERSAKAALETNQEAVGCRHIQRKLDVTHAAGQLEEQRKAVAAEIQTLRSAIDTYRPEIDRVEREQHTWEMRERTAQLRNSMDTRAPSSSALAQARELLTASRDAAMREEARTETRDLLAESDATRRIDERRNNLAVEKELQRLRSEMLGSGDK